MDNLSPEQRETLWRRNPDASRHAELNSRPESIQEERLTAALAQMPDKPLPSNFTARVLNAIDHEEALSARSKGWNWSWHLLLPRIAVAMVVLFFAGLALQHHETSRLHRAELAEGLQMVANAKTVPDIDALKNFDAIQRMSQAVHADTDLLVALQ